jgi:CDGSH-type Zn-finger protein
MNSNNRLGKNKLRIKVVQNGPYIVSGGVPLTIQQILLDADGECHGWQEMKQFPDLKIYSLCRCGKSRNKPYCDDSHKSGFDGNETAGYASYAELSKTYIGEKIDLTDAKSLCMHAGFCDRAGGIWNLVKQSDNLEARKTAIEESCDCPSGRLVTWDKTGNPIEPNFKSSISIIQSHNDEFQGPIWVRGGIPIESVNGNLYEIRNRITLCGCGHSHNKPFCDGAHGNHRLKNKHRDVHMQV